jgi:hypothetical protein
LEKIAPGDLGGIQPLLEKVGMHILILSSFALIGQSMVEPRLMRGFVGHGWWR